MYNNKDSIGLVMTVSSDHTVHYSQDIGYNDGLNTEYEKTTPNTCTSVATEHTKNPCSMQNASLTVDPK